MCACDIALARADLLALSRANLRALARTRARDIGCMTR
jgi:hypothetical protein